jgi:hypothetical protein
MTKLADHTVLRRNILFYDILQTAAMQMKFKQGKAHDLNPKEMLLAKNYRFFVQTNAKNKYDIME